MNYKINEHTIIVDDGFAFNPELFSVYKLRNGFYCYTKRGGIALHHLVIGCPYGKVVDHIDHNGLNNKISNLRFASYSQNSFNRSPAVADKIKGIYTCSKTGKFYARIQIEGIRFSSGPFLRKEEALAKYKTLLSRVAEGKE